MRTSPALSLTLVPTSNRPGRLLRATRDIVSETSPPSSLGPIIFAKTYYSFKSRQKFFIADPGKTCSAALLFSFFHFFVSVLAHLQRKALLLPGSILPSLALANAPNGFLFCLRPPAWAAFKPSGRPEMPGAKGFPHRLWPALTPWPRRCTALSASAPPSLAFSRKVLLLFSQTTF